jgi:hypothetical protein
VLGLGRQEDSPFRAGKPAETVQSTRPDLAHAFLRDSQLRADLAQGLLAGTSDPEAAGEDPPLAVVETSEQVRDDSLLPILNELLFDRVGTSVHGVLEDSGACRDEPNAEALVPSIGPDSFQIAQVA